MIIFDSVLDIFRFAHLSVREFLEKRLEYGAAKTNSLATKRRLLDFLSIANHLLTRNFLSSHRAELPDSLSYRISSYVAIY